MSSQVTPEIRQRILQSVNAVTELRPLGVILAVDEESHVLRKPQKAPVENPYIVVEVNTSKPTVSFREAGAEAGLLRSTVRRL